MTDQSPIDQTPAGLDRRTMLKRSAIVGGALVWTTPVVQSLAGPAFAQTQGSPPPNIEGCINGAEPVLFFFTASPDLVGFETTPQGTCEPAGYTGDETTTLPAGVSLSFDDETVTVTLPAGYEVVSASLKAGSGNDDADADENGCYLATSIDGPNPAGPGKVSYTLENNAMDKSPAISHISVIFSGCPV